VLVGLESGVSQSGYRSRTFETALATALLAPRDRRLQIH
jgi:hypothetical protein